MKLKEVLKDAHKFSGKVSDITRQHAFAGLAAIWIFRPVQPNGSMVLPRILYLSGIFMIISLIVDLFQYLFSAIIWKSFHRNREKEGISAETQLKLPRYNVPLYFLFYLKIIALIVGYFYLFYFIANNIALYGSENSSSELRFALLNLLSQKLLVKEVPMYIQAIIGFGGVILGFLLAFFGDWVKETREKKKKKQSVQKLISLELNKNIEFLRKYWENAFSEKIRDEKGGFIYSRLADEIATTPFPNISLVAWNSHLAEITSCFDYNQIKFLWEYKTNLERLIDLYSFFKEARGERETKSLDIDNRLTTLIASSEFYKKVSDEAKEFKEIIEKLITNI